MKVQGVNPDPKNRVALDTELRTKIKAALDAETISVEETVFLLTRMLPDLCPEQVGVGNVAAAYALRKNPNEPGALIKDSRGQVYQRQQNGSLVRVGVQTR